MNEWRNVEYINMSNNWKSKNRHKYLLQYHLIFVCKYRKKLLISKNISDDIKQFSYEICQKHNVTIHKMETDKDRIHYMIETDPTINLSNLVSTMKLLQLTIYGNFIKFIYPNISGKRIPFG